MQMLVQCGMARRFLRDEAATTSIEYALIASGITVVIASTVYSIGPGLNGIFEKVRTGFK